MTKGSDPLPWTRRLSGPLCVLAVALSSGGAFAGDTIDLVFRPPAIAPDPVCESPPTDDETMDFWGQWDGRVLPDRPMRSIRRDVNRLIQIDAVRWFDTTARMMDLLEKSDPAFAAQTALLMRIAALEAAGKFEELTQSGLVIALAMQAETLTPAGRLVLSRFMRDGIGIAADPVMADSLLTEAGYAGDPRALMALAALQLAGKAPEGWTVPPELAVITAFGNMVGEPDPTICERTARIATHFRSGEIVTPDPQLAHDWYRFTADLGSGHAAWRVVDYHMRAEGFVKSNEVLLRYLETAAAADLSYAQIELGRVLERGALAPPDLGRAHALYEAAARSGDLRGLSRFALFLRRHEATNPAFREPRLAVLRQLIVRKDAPGWAFSQLAEAVLEDQGRWAGAAAARDLLDEAVERGDLNGHVLLARLILSDSPGGAEIDRAVDLLSRVVNERGGAQPMNMLRAALVCRGQEAPDREGADYWRAQADAIGVSDSAVGAGPLQGLRMATDWARIAEIQSFAISGSPDGLAMWRRLAEVAPFADEAMRRFWSTYFAETDARLVARAELDLSLTDNPDLHDVIFAALRDRHIIAGPEFTALLRESLMAGMYGPAAVARLSAEAGSAAVDLLTRSAGQGYGLAMTALAALTTDPAERQAIFDRFRDIIDADGDFAAQRFGARYSGTPGPYMARAAGIMPCDFGAAMEMAALGKDLGDQARVERWLEVADILAVERPSQMISLARTYLRPGNAQDLPRAFELLTEASARGDTRADGEILELIATPGTSFYDPDRAARMIAGALETGRSGVLGRYLSVFRGADAATRDRIAAKLDMARVYRVAAESGDPVAMRIHGLVLREQAVDSAELARAMGWLSRAAEAGDTRAMTEFGQALAFGIGVPVDRAQALEWLERAAARGSDEAREITRLVGMSGGAGQ